MDLGSFLGLDEGTLDIFRLLSESRMGLYRHEGSDGSPDIRLNEIFTNRRILCRNPSGYEGAAGEIWFVRTVPPPFETGELYTVMTTPYVVRGASAGD